MTAQQGLRIVVGCDDAGYQYKEKLADDLRSDPRVAGVVDVGVGADPGGASELRAIVSRIVSRSGRR